MLRLTYFPMSLCLFCLVSSLEALAETPPMPREVAAIFENKCVSCHSDDNLKGGLSLQHAQQALEGGESGPVIIQHEPDSSYLLELITPDQHGAAMPKSGDPLSPAEVQAVRDWIQAGAPWPKKQTLTPPRWWSLSPLVAVPLPKLDPSQAAWVRTPIDNFVARKHAQLGLSPSPEADRRTLIRRIYFDLIGLPPTPEEIDSFVSDPDPDAYQRLVDSLLASPHYGERWARHWLDLVHFGETHGYDKDKPRPNAWPYRDYVIRSLNEDKPYSRFIQEQIAGDVLFPGTADGIEGLGFLAAGPWDFIGHVEVPESKTDGKIARHLDRDDMVQNTMMTFNSVTVGCAQCHDHKFDPISQEDYYSLQSVFAAIDRTDKAYFRDPDLNRKWEELTSQKETFAKQQAEIKSTIQKLGGSELARLDQKIAAHEKPSDGHPPQYGYHSEIASSPDQSQWVQIDLEKSIAISELEYIACFDDYNRIGAGFGFPPRFKIEVSDNPQFDRDVTMLLDHTAANVPNPLLRPQSFKTSKTSARYVRFTAMRLASRLNDYIFALAELRVFDQAGNNVALGKPVTASTTIELPVRWALKNLVDDIHPNAPASDSVVQALHDQRKVILEKSVPAEMQQRYDAVTDQLARVDQQLESLPARDHIYAGSIHHGSGAFRGTGPSGGEPREIRLLYRGNVSTPGPVVSPKSLDCIEGLSAELNLEDDSSEGQRRAALARWLTDSRNPLTWRSIVNRIWQYHMGQAIVATPNDFGRMGQLPTHPELLEWLAMEFRDGGQSLKQMHRLIVLSATYRQSSHDITRYDQVDKNNRYFWRAQRRHLDSEELRDTVLSVAGKLDLKMWGPSFQNFVIEKPQHSPHYQYHLHDPDDPKSHRRSIYRFLVRSQTDPFMTVFNCADPSMQVAQRNNSITPLQALSMMNNKLTIVMAQHFAERVEEERDSLDQQVARAMELALGRSPRSEEMDALTTYAQQHGLANTCRLILNLNEFVLVD
ncbi:DUF1553 domain-containing protein [Bremerella alba]|uniref:Cytochrome c domain-containing protein n=1 Tax=Bremerella alba TaxID=980252 RepID=A0A7V8VAB4_9BACT|nr:DUF1553 domain-containing protein [Bremerella alba]MBA2117835.1 hypothetical protein [Bremerella alba]